MEVFKVIHVVLLLYGIRILLYDNDFYAVFCGRGGVLVAMVADERTGSGEGDPQHECNSVTECCLSALPYLFQQEIEKEVADQYPDGAAECAGDFVPLHKFGAVAEHVAEVEPWPSQVPVEVKVLPRAPEGDEGERRGDGR